MTWCQARLYKSEILSGVKFEARCNSHKVFKCILPVLPVVKQVQSNHDEGVRIDVISMLKLITGIEDDGVMVIA